MIPDPKHYCWECAHLTEPVSPYNRTCAKGHKVTKAFHPHPFHGGLNPGRGYSQPSNLDLRCGTRERNGCPDYKPSNQ